MVESKNKYFNTEKSYAIMIIIMKKKLELKNLTSWRRFWLQILGDNFPFRGNEIKLEVEYAGRFPFKGVSCFIIN